MNVIGLTSNSADLPLTKTERKGAKWTQGRRWVRLAHSPPPGCCCPIGAPEQLAEPGLVLKAKREGVGLPGEGEGGHAIPGIFLWALQVRFLGRFNASEGAEVMNGSCEWQPAEVSHLIFWIEKRPGSCFSGGEETGRMEAW